MSEFRFTEAELEETALEWLEEVGYSTVSGSQFDPEQELSSRSSYSDVVLVDHLRNALVNVNPSLTIEVIDDAIRQISTLSHPDSMTMNRSFHQFITDGIDVETREGTRNTTKKSLVV